jgi:hypothetical protein
MSIKPQILFLPILLILNSCIAQFIPQISEEKELLVVQGLITDQPEPDTIKLSKSMPLGETNSARPLSGSRVDITDDLNNVVSLNEIAPGTYITPSNFRGQVGRFYTLHVHTSGISGNLNYESAAMEMKPVPTIDSLYYTKTVIQQAEGFDKGINGCQIYLDTRDPLNKCKYYRWDFTETWEFRLPFAVPNETCWIKEKSKAINIKSTVAFDEARITRFPINYISNVTDRLKTRYSILVNQYSLGEEEYAYWEKIQNVAIQVGGLYDIIPASVSSNISCIENPTEKVLGYFSVSAKSSKRIFIKDNFAGIIDHYNKCVTDTIYSTNYPGLNINSWIIIAHLCSIPCVPFFEITTHKECEDCTLRGTNIKPDFWNDDK